MRYRHLGVPLAVAVLLAVVAMPAVAAERFITVASTTSTENSGLFGFILPQFQQATEIEVRVVAVGTGQAIKNAERGDADVLFVHHQPSEEQFVAQGFGVKRHDVMYNDYVLLGPQADRAGIKGTKDTVAALTQIAARNGEREPASKADSRARTSNRVRVVLGCKRPKGGTAWARPHARS